MISSSLQFDPAPRAGEPLVSRRPPDYVSPSEIFHRTSFRDADFFFKTSTVPIDVSFVLRASLHNPVHNGCIRRAPRDEHYGKNHTLSTRSSLFSLSSLTARARPTTHWVPIEKPIGEKTCRWAGEHRCLAFLGRSCCRGDRVMKV